MPALLGQADLPDAATRLHRHPVVFLFALSAVVLTAPILAFLSGLVLLVAILTFRFRSWVNE